MNDSTLNCGGDRLGAVRHAEFAENAFEVILHRVFGDSKNVGNFLVGQALGKLTQHLAFTGGQFFEQLAVAAGGTPDGPPHLWESIVDQQPPRAGPGSAFRRWNS